jgi:hypothetical protein
MAIFSFPKHYKHKAVALFFGGLLLLGLLLVRDHGVSFDEGTQRLTR